jgi:transcriptional regulator with XRE-family HTH domain
MTKTLTYKRKLARILGISDWSRDKLADLLEISNNTLNAWLAGKSEPKLAHAGRVDKIYDELIVPLLCEIDDKADAVEKRLLSERIKRLPDDNICKVE